MMTKHTYISFTHRIVHYENIDNHEKKNYCYKGCSSLLQPKESERNGLPVSLLLSGKKKKKSSDTINRENYSCYVTAMYIVCMHLFLKDNKKAVHKGYT